MNSELETFFKDIPLGIKSVLQASVHLAEKVNSRTDLSGKEKTDLVVKSLVEFLGEGKPELVALVEAVVPGVLEIVISTARGKYMLKQVTSCLPSCLPAGSVVKASTASPPAPQDPANEVSGPMTGVWAWVRSPFFRSAPASLAPQGASPASNDTPVTTIREPVAA